LRKLRARSTDHLGPRIHLYPLHAVGDGSAVSEVPTVARSFLLGISDGADYLRVNADFLNNVFNMPGTQTPGGDGVILNRTSANSPWVLQLTMRLTW